MQFPTTHHRLEGGPYWATTHVLCLHTAELPEREVVTNPLVPFTLELGHSEPAPSSAPSTGCLLLLSCG